MTIPEKLLLRANEVAFTSSSIDEFLQIKVILVLSLFNQTELYCALDVFVYEF